MLEACLSKMNVVDLSHTIEPGMPVYPGTEPPDFSIPCTIEDDGFTEKKLTFYSHTGTHMDAPAHILTGAPTLDQLNIAHFVGSATALDLSTLGKPLIEVEDLLPFKPQIEGKDFIILYTGWSHLWGQETYFEGYPVLSSEAAAWLLPFASKGIGVDMISVDGPETTLFPVHRVILGGNRVIIENLTNLEGLLNTTFLFCCQPLKIVQADGSPVRAMALT